MIILINGSDSLSLMHDEPLKPGVELVCRTCMTHLSFPVPKDFDVETPIDHQDYEEKYLKILSVVKANKDNAWNILGYCGIEFISWLENVHDDVLIPPDNRQKNYKHLTDDEIHSIKVAYIVGIDLVSKVFFN
jgi:hypothetical protein